MVVTNNGPNGATNVTVADPVPAGTTFVSVDDLDGHLHGSGGVVNCQLGSLAVGASVTITLVTTAGQTGTLTNTATTVGGGAGDEHGQQHGDRIGRGERRRSCRR